LRKERAGQLKPVFDTGNAKRRRQVSERGESVGCVKRKKNCWTQQKALRGGKKRRCQDSIRWEKRKNPCAIEKKMRRGLSMTPREKDDCRIESREPVFEKSKRRFRERRMAASDKQIGTSLGKKRGHLLERKKREERAHIRKKAASW